MKLAGKHAFACTILAREQNTYIALGYLLHGCKNLLHRGGLRNNASFRLTGVP